MRAVVLDGRGNHQLVDTSAPVPQVGEVVIEPAAVGVCGTDLHLVIGDYPTGRFPVVPGHEFAGRIVEVGPGVDNLTVGQHVAVDPNVACGKCADCLAGAPNLCDYLVPIGVTSDGACADLVSVPAKVVYPLPDGMSMAAGALIEPLSCVLHGLFRSPSLTDRRITVFGAGSIGLLAVVVARAAGARTIHVVEPSPARRKAALDLGADAAFAPDENLPARSADIALEASGHPAAVSAAIDLLDKRGTLLQMGVVSSEKTIPLRPYDLFDRELTFVGSQSVANSFADAVAMMPSITETAEKLVTHTFSLAEYGEAIAAAHSDSALKVHILPHS
ncbi:alcohol dehydrogenase catalytic domain-containing protein [Rhodococcus pseudokoreensis]|uniref:Alcohol dehydrogenase catalytic domain-containing protein n=1 Tax=Rhodococcus pseudokoreensis TaxID=2811421 RepID=A0A974ZVV7_9NOCA|nr:alcohol dehydrogenase catalytic domain-containing protein [Rhodococcus pseudokoreensis]QSE92376.1 alcohol dehydrogenase catalytic domain-containing protein [Rhodococcus pseudokoreensis]